MIGGHVAKSTEKIEQLPRRAIESSGMSDFRVITCASAKAADLFDSEEVVSMVANLCVYSSNLVRQKSEFVELGSNLHLACTTANTWT